MNDPLFTFDEKGHQYKYDGKPVTGVTSVIGVLAKPALIGWAAKMAVEYIREYFNDNNRSLKTEGGDLENVFRAAEVAHTKKKEAAGTHGTDAHALVELYVKACIDGNNARPLPLAEETENSIKPFIDWAQENVETFLFSERRMFNKDLFIAGTADFAYVGKDGKRYMADFKTSSGIYGIDYWLQVAAYRLLAEAEGDEPYDGATVVRLGKNGDFEVQHRFDYETDKEAFLACLTLYRAQATYIKPKK